MRKAIVTTLTLVFAFVFAGAAMAETKPSIAVAEFKNETSAGWWSGGVGDDLAAMLTNELAATGSFKMVERKNLGAILDEQDLGDSGRVSQKTAAKIGKMTGAKYLVIGTVSAYEENTKGGGGGISVRGISLGGKKDEAYIAIDLRVVDTTTGEIEHVRTIEARSSGFGVNVGLYRGGFGGDLEKYERTPTGKAIRACLVEATDYLSCVMVDQDGCEDEYKAKEKSRRKKTKDSISLD